MIKTKILRAGEAVDAWVSGDGSVVILAIFSYPDRCELCTPAGSFTVLLPPDKLAAQIEDSRDPE